MIGGLTRDAAKNALLYPAFGAGDDSPDIHGKDYEGSSEARFARVSGFTPVGLHGVDCSFSLFGRTRRGAR